MAGIIEDFAKVLEEENECYEGLETLAKYTEMAVVEKQIDFLEKVVQTEEQFIGRLNILGKKRDVLFKDIALVTGLSPDGLTVTDVIEKIGPETEMGEKLTEIRNEMKEHAENIRKKSELNKQLLSDSLDMVNFNLNAINTSRDNSYLVGYTNPTKANQPTHEIPASSFNFNQ